MLYCEKKKSRRKMAFQRHNSWIDPLLRSPAITQKYSGPTALSLPYIATCPLGTVVPRPRSTYDSVNGSRGPTTAADAHSDAHLEPLPHCPLWHARRRKSRAVDDAAASARRFHGLLFVLPLGFRATLLWRGCTSLKHDGRAVSPRSPVGGSNLQCLRPLLT